LRSAPTRTFAGGTRGLRLLLAGACACGALAIAGQVWAQEIDPNDVPVQSAGSLQNNIAPVQATNILENNGVSETNGIDSSSYDRGRNVSVQQRPRPDYDAIGLHVPGFMIYPKVDLGLAYDDNILAVQSGGVGDEIFTATPEIDFNSTWSRNGLAGWLRASQDLYFQHTGEDATEADGGLEGRLDLGNSDLRAGGQYGRFVLPRWASNNIGLPVHRILYNYGAANVQFEHEFARVRLSARADYQDYTYFNGATSAGAVVFERDQNHYVVTGSGKAEFAVSPDTAVYVTAEGNERRFDLQPPTVSFTRNSSGFEVDAGANFDITHLTRGEIQIGYLDQSYVSPLFRPIRGLGGMAQLEWFPTQLITVTVRGSRAVGDAGVIGSAGYLTSNASGQVDYELLRNVILSGNLWDDQDKYNGVDRTDDRLGAGASAKWLLNRHLGLTFAYTYDHQSSHGTAAGPSFNDNRVSVSAIVQY